MDRFDDLRTPVGAITGPASRRSVLARLAALGLTVTTAGVLVPHGGGAAPRRAPLKLYFRGGSDDNYSTASTEGERAALAAGYTFVRIEGYVSRTPGRGLVPLKTFFRGGSDDNYSTATAEGEQAALAAGYTFVRTEGYIARTKQRGTTTLKTYFHGGREDNFTTATAAGRQSALDSGYTFARNEGFVFKQP